MEIWRQINLPKYGKFNYEVSNMGRVRNRFTKHICSPGFHSDGYVHVSLFRDNSLHTFRVARLVANAYLPPRKPGQQIHHLDVKTNNQSTALQYVTQAQNIRKSYEAGRTITRIIPRFDKRIYRMIFHLRQRNLSQVKIARILGIDNSSVSRILAGRIAAALPYMRAS